MRCNSMLHFGRDEGVEMVVAYHGVISTVRLQGKCAWDFLGEFFKNIFNGCKDFVNLIPQNIKLVCTNIKLGRCYKSAYTLVHALI